MTTGTGRRDDAGTGPEDRSRAWYASAVRAADASVERTIPNDGGNLLLYHAVCGIDPDRFAEALSGFEIVDDVREIERSDDDARLEAHVSPRKLTDRQRTALETALAAGFFDWPRGSTGEEVAESFGVSSATLHQHLRISERKLLQAFFEGPAEG